MSTTTFSGPVKAGNIFNTTGTTLSENVSNQGQATMVQVATITEAPAVGVNTWTDIVIPANSQITRMAVLVTVRFDGGGAYNTIWIDDDRPTDPQLGQMSGASVGLVECNGTDVLDPDKWKDVGTSDIHLSFIVHGSSTTEIGTAELIVEYIQNNNLVTA